MSNDPLFMTLGRRRFLQGSGAAIALLALGGGVRQAAAADLSARFGYGSVGYTWTVAFVAEEAGTWKDAGVELTALDFPTGRESMQALLAGSLDFGTSTDTPVVFSALGGLRPIILASYSRYSRDMKLVVRPDRGIDPADPASIRGKTIATRVGTSGQYFLSRYLLLAGLEPDTVTVVDLPPADMVTALVRGDIDGFAWTSQAAALASERSDGATATMNDDDLPDYFRSHQLLLTNESVVESRPEILEPAIAAFLAAQDRIHADGTWVDLVAARVKAEPDVVRAATDEFEFDIRLDTALLDDLVEHGEWAIEAGLVEKPAGDLRELFRGLIHEKPLAALAPDRVSL